MGMLGDFNTWAWKRKATKENGERERKILLWGMCLPFIFFVKTILMLSTNVVNTMCWNLYMYNVQFKHV